MRHPHQTLNPKSGALLASVIAASVALSVAAPAQVLGPPAAPVASGGLLAPTIDADKVLAPLGLTPQGAVYAKKKHQEVMAVTKDGRPVVVAFDWAGRVKSVTDANHRKGRTAGAVAPPPAQLASLVKSAGFEPVGVVETKRHHVVMRAKNKQGENLDLHIDFAGTIYKQVWLR